MIHFALVCLNDWPIRMVSILGLQSVKKMKHCVSYRATITSAFIVLIFVSTFLSGQLFNDATATLTADQRESMGAWADTLLIVGCAAQTVVIFTRNTEIRQHVKKLLKNRFHAGNVAAIELGHFPVVPA